MGRTQRSRSGFGPGRYRGRFAGFWRRTRRAGWEFLRLAGDIALCRVQDGQEPRSGLRIFTGALGHVRVEWPVLMDEFFGTLRAVEQEPELPVQLADVSDRLLVRLGLPLRAPVKEAAVWSVPLEGTALFVNLVLDYPDRMCYVTEKLVADSGKPGSFWLEQARANLLGRTPAGCFEIIHEESGLRTCSVADAYDSSRALILESLLPDSRDLGYLFVIPGRDELLVMPVSAHALPHVQLLKMLATKNYRSVPYPISEDVLATPMCGIIFQSK